MQKAKVRIESDLGMHARTAFAFAEKGRLFESDISVINNGRKANGKEVLDILSLAIMPGASMLIETSGSDEIEALDSLKDFLRSADVS